MITHRIARVNNAEYELTFSGWVFAEYMPERLASSLRTRLHVLECLTKSKTFHVAPKCNKSFHSSVMHTTGLNKYRQCITVHHARWCISRYICCRNACFKQTFYQEIAFLYISSSRKHAILHGWWSITIRHIGRALQPPGPCKDKLTLFSLNEKIAGP